MCRSACLSLFFTVKHCKFEISTSPPLDLIEMLKVFTPPASAGKLVNNWIAWRGDSGLEDGREEGVHLSRGMYDAGDLMTFSFPIAFTATVLSWAILEYGDQMNAVTQLDDAHDQSNGSPTILSIPMDPEM